MDELTIGRVVHFRAPETHGRCWPAIVSHVWPGDVVNVAAIDQIGTAVGKTSVQPEPARPELGPVWHWPGRHEPALRLPPLEQPEAVPELEAPPAPPASAPEDPRDAEIRNLRAELALAREPRTFDEDQAAEETAIAVSERKASSSPKTKSS